MALLIFSNNGDWNRDNIALVTIIKDVVVADKGIIQAVQDYIHDTGVLDEIYEDEHKGIEVHEIGESEEFWEILESLEYTLWSDSNLFPSHYVIIQTSEGVFVYVIFKT